MVAHVPPGWQQLVANNLGALKCRQTWTSHLMQTCERHTAGQAELHVTTTLQSVTYHQSYSQVV